MENLYPANFMPCFPCKYHVNNMKKFHVNCMEVPWNPAGICPLIACYLHGDDVMKNLYICVLITWRRCNEKLVYLRVICMEKFCAKNIALLQMTH